MIATLGPGFGATATGWDASIENGFVLGPAEAEADAPGLYAITPLEDRTRLPLRVSVRTPSRDFIAHVPHRFVVQGVVEHNATGSGQFNLRGDDVTLESNPTLLEDGNLVDVHYGDRLIHTWVMETDGEDIARSRDVTLARTGRGDLSLLDYAVLYPEGELDRDTAEDRYFNFGAAVGPWYVAAQWARPRAVSQKQSDRWPFPRKFPVRSAKWIWSSNPEKKSKEGPRYFRTTLTLEERTRVRIWAAGDEDLFLLVDGRPVLRQRNRRWNMARNTTMSLSAGDHVIAARVDNTDRGKEQRGGLVLTIAKVNRKDRIQSVLLRSRPAGWKVYGPRRNPPGWFPAQVLHTFVTEAQARGVESFDGISLGFTPTHDSAGRAWSDRLSQSYKIGTNGLDLTRQLIELGMDVAMFDGTLLAWIDRSEDRRHTVALDGYVSARTDRVSSTVFNTALSRYRRGWEEFIDQESQDVYGRREAPISSGGADERTDAGEQADAAFREYADPTATIEVVTNSLRGPQPFYHYQIGDIVTSPLDDEGRGPCQVLAIGYEEDEAGVVTWSHQMYPLAE